LQAGLTEGVNDFSLKYDFPLHRFNSYISGYYINSDSQFIEDETSQLDISNVTTIFGVDWTLNVINNLFRIDSTSFGFESLKNRNSIIGTDEENVFLVSAHQVVDAFRFSHTVDSTIRIGKTTTHGLYNDTSMFSLVKVKSNSVRRLSSNKGIVKFKSSSQLFSNSLRDMERFSMGGFYSVRGYRENTLVRDNGVIFNAEYLFPLILPELTAVVFSDVASGWSEQTKSTQLFSIGAGLNWNKHKKLNADTFIGIPLMNKSNKSGNLQDLGLHFGMQYSL